jgi:ADP-ribose pyrophosphatase
MDSVYPFPHEETISSERGFDGKLVHVRVDRVRLPSGRESVREVVEHPGAVALLGITTNDELILVRQWRHAVGRAMLEIPAGTREPGESESETARRELLEETGYTAGTISQIARYYSSAGFCDEEMTLFLAEHCISRGQVEDVDERTNVVLVPRAGVRSLLEPGPNQVHDAKSLIGVLWLLSN